MSKISNWMKINNTNWKRMIFGIILFILAIPIWVPSFLVSLIVLPYIKSGYALAEIVDEKFMEWLDK